MKVSISLPPEDIEFLDRYGERVGAASRSAVVHRAVQLLRASSLGPAYAEAWEEFEEEGGAAAWDSTAGDGLEPGERRP